MNKNESKEIDTNEDAKLFLLFVNEVRRNPKVRHQSEVISAHKKKIRFKSLNNDLESLMFYTPALPMIDDNTEFTCKYCGAKYVYKRCLINHMVRNHRKKLLRR